MRVHDAKLVFSSLTLARYRNLSDQLRPPIIFGYVEFILRNQVSLAFITESWLKPSVCDSVIDIPGYSVLRKDRGSESHGGICLYLKDTNYKRLDELSCCQDHEILWVKLRPKRLPRGFSYLIAGVVYHPHWTATENDCMRDHLFQSLLLAESRFPNCALIVAGDFNRLDVTSIQRHFRLKQIVKKPTRKNAILDLVLTNMHDYTLILNTSHLLAFLITILLSWRLK